MGIGSRGRTSILFVAFLLIVPGIVQATALSSDNLDGQTYAYAVDSASSGIQWKSSDLFYGNPTLAYDGTTYVLIAEVDNNNMKKSVALRAFDPSGGEKWEVPIDGTSTNPVLGRDGNIYLVLQSYDISNSTDSRLVSLDTNGGVRWTFSLQGLISSKDAAMGVPVVHPNGQILVPIYSPYDSAQKKSGQIWSFSETGKLLWTCDVSANYGNVYVGDMVNSIIYVTSYRGTVQGIQPNGTLAWTSECYYDEGLAFISSPSLVGPNGSLYMPVNRLDPETEWRNYTSPPEIMVIDQTGVVVMETSLYSDLEALFDGDIVPMGISRNGTIYCYNVNGYGVDAYGIADFSQLLVPSRAMAVSPQGEVLWSYKLVNESLYSLPILTRSTLYLFTLNTTEVGKIVALQLDNGSLLGTYSAPNKLWLTGAAVGDDERFLYFEGTYKGAEEGMITLVSTVGLPQVSVPRPLDLVAATVAWGSIFGLMLGGGYYVTHKRRL